MTFSSVQRKIETALWSKPSDDPKERKLVAKLDGVILTYCCLMYFSNYLDRANLANAYVSGMKEDVGFEGNQYTLANSVFTAGYIVGQWPSALVLSSNRIPARLWFPFCMVAWGVCTLGLAFVRTPHQVWGVRFVQALFEASTFSGVHYILGSWYKDNELGARTAVFATAAQIGTLFSGIMQGAIISTLQGRGGLEGWQWLFIMDFIITVPIAIYGFIMFPDMPHTVKAFWLTEDERQLCISRLPQTQHVKMTWSVLRSSIKRIVTTWRWYMFCLLFTISATAFEKTGVYTEFLFWLKSTGTYTAEQINYYPSVFTSFAIVSTYCLTVMSDRTGNRFIVNPIMYTAVFISSVMLLVWNIGVGGHWFAYIIAGFGYAGQASNFAWANSMCRDDEILRAVTLASMNLFSNIWALWYGIAIWPVTDAPRFRNGQIATLVTGAVAVGIAVGIVYCSRRWPPAVPALKPELFETQEDVERTGAENQLDFEDKGANLGVAVQPVSKF